MPMTEYKPVENLNESKTLKQTAKKITEQIYKGYHRTPVTDPAIGSHQGWENYWRDKTYWCSSVTSTKHRYIPTIIHRTDNQQSPTYCTENYIQYPVIKP